MAILLRRLLPKRYLALLDLRTLRRVPTDHVDEAPDGTKRLPLILPIVLLQHRARSTPTRFSEILDLPPEALAAFGSPLELELFVDDLSGTVLDDPKASRPTKAFVELARVLLHAYANPEARLEQRIEELAQLFDDLPDPNDSDDAETIWSYIVAAYGTKSSIYKRFRKTISQRSRQMLDMINNDWFQDGRTQGFAEARACSLLDVLELRGLAPSPELRAQILSISDPQTLERWFRRALSATSLNDLLRPIETTTRST